MPTVNVITIYNCLFIPYSGSPEIRAKQTIKGYFKGHEIDEVNILLMLFLYIFY